MRDFVRALPPVGEGRRRSSRARVTPRGIRRFAVGLALLTALTWISGLADLPGESLGEIAFEDAAGFPGAHGRWQTFGERANVTLGSDDVLLERNAPGRSRSQMVGELPPIVGEETHTLLRARVRVETIDGVGTRPAGALPFVGVRLLDDDGETVGQRVVATVPTTPGVRFAEREVRVPPAARTFALEFAFRDKASGGAYRLADARLDLTRATPGRRLVGWVMVLSWTTTLAIALWWLAGRLPSRVTVGLALALSSVVAGASTPPVVGGTVSRWLLPLVDARLPAAWNLDFMVFLKVAHVATFLVVAGLVVGQRVRLKLSRPMALMLLGLLAAATEGMQLHLPGRTARLEHLALDLAGIAFAVLALEAGRRGAALLRSERAAG